ncbi:MAG: zinc ABC transporter substrate-binding protein [Ahrensia sp.]|nr:zinc ABC transporter substrate-binding protein [Ahrensia sp.]|tara:strand:+ start:14586 stop:15560 length:975 start_codon:yes stop_codon:yes gene_type:complete
MKRFRTFLLATAALGATAFSAHADVNVIASIKPVQSLVAAVMQGAGEPSLIVEGAGSPHTYSLKPSQAAALQKADLIFWVGDNLEAFLEKPISTIGNAKSVELIDAHGLETLGLREGGAFEEHMHDGEHADEDHDHEAEHAESHEDDHHHDEIDMHVWLDPVNAKAMADDIAEALSEADPDNAALYKKNAADLSARIDTLTTELSAELAPIKDKGFIVFHDGYQYFEHRFGLSAAGSITVSPDVMPGADRIRQIQAKIGELGATCVFAEPQFEPKLIAVATEGSDARSGVLDPLGANIEAGPELYFTLMHNMAESFSTCLSGAS